MYEMKAMKCPECGATMKGGKCPNGCKPGSGGGSSKKGGAGKKPVPPFFQKKK